jgi:hypothetical protein
VLGGHEIGRDEQEDHVGGTQLGRGDLVLLCPRRHQPGVPDLERDGAGDGLQAGQQLVAVALVPGVGGDENLEATRAGGAGHLDLLDSAGMITGNLATAGRPVSIPVPARATN